MVGGRVCRLHNPLLRSFCSKVLKSLAFSRLLVDCGMVVCVFITAPRTGCFVERGFLAVSCHLFIEFVAAHVLTSVGRCLDLRPSVLPGSAVGTVPVCLSLSVHGRV